MNSNNSLRLPIILAALWFVVKFVMLQLGYADEKVGVGLNFFFIVLIIFLALRRQAGVTEFVPLVKSAVRPAALYIILAAFAVFIYYQWVDPGYLSGAFERAMGDMSQSISDAGGFEEYKKQVPGIKETSEEAYLVAQRDRFSGFISPFSAYGRASIALITLTFFAVFYSVFMVAILLVAQRYLKKR